MRLLPLTMTTTVFSNWLAAWSRMRAAALIHVRDVLAVSLAGVVSLFAIIYLYLVLVA